MGPKEIGKEMEPMKFGRQRALFIHVNMAVLNAFFCMRRQAHSARVKASIFADSLVHVKMHIFIVSCSNM